jgi:hypothetical protein
METVAALALAAGKAAGSESAKAALWATISDNRVILIHL